MGPYILRRLLLLIPVLIAISIVSFSLIHLAPGDPALVILRAQGSQRITPEALEQVRTEMGLNDPPPVQYVRWMWRALQLDLGTSVRTGTPVAELILSRLPATVQLAVAGLLLAGIIALPLGVVTAVKQHSLVDHAGRVFAFLGASMPSFWLSLLLLSIAALSFLGLGAQAPEPEWGRILNDARPFMQIAPHTMMFPGLAIFLSVMAFNLLGDGLRDALDPQGQK
jgi:ABC-type dipeptide/oligopeptide/nickel transport system permease component